MGGTKCLRLGTCELEDMGGVLQRNSSISLAYRRSAWDEYVCPSSPQTSPGPHPATTTLPTAQKDLMFQMSE